MLRAPRPSGAERRHDVGDWHAVRRLLLLFRRKRDRERRQSDGGRAGRLQQLLFGFGWSNADCQRERVGRRGLQRVFGQRRLVHGQGNVHLDPQLISLLRTVRQSSSRRCKKTCTGAASRSRPTRRRRSRSAPRGGAAAGTITIDAGKTVTEAGSFTAPTIVDKGTLKVAPGERLTRRRDAGGRRERGHRRGSDVGPSGRADGRRQGDHRRRFEPGPLSDANGSGVQIAFSGAGGTLGLDTSDLNASSVFVPTISGLGSGDVIDLYDPYATITRALCKRRAQSLRRIDGGRDAQHRLGLQGFFSALPVGGGATQIDYLGGGRAGRRRARRARIRMCGSARSRGIGTRRRTRTM